MSESDIIDKLRQEISERVAAARTSAELDHLDIEYLGRKGKLTQLLRRVGELLPEERPIFGSRVNRAKEKLTQLIQSRRQSVAGNEVAEKLRTEALDVSLPGRFYRIGRPHILSETMQEIKRIFIGLGYEFVDAPEIESYYYNFESLYYPEEHPAMDEQMSFYVTDDRLMRAQTTAYQARVMQG